MPRGGGCGWSQRQERGVVERMGVRHPTVAPLVPCLGESGDVGSYPGVIAGRLSWKLERGVAARMESPVVGVGRLGV